MAILATSSCASLPRPTTQFHIYADVTLYVEFDFQDVSSFLKALLTLEECIKEIRAWMVRNRLMFNEGKSEFQIIVPRHYKAKFAALSPYLRVWSTPVFPSQAVLHLGVTLDAEMSLSTHVGNIIRSMYMHMRHISRMRHHLDDTTLLKVVMALVISRLDYANSALYGVTDYLLNKQQLAQNNAARLARKSKKYDHITPVLKDQHWLPVKSRIIFKVLSIVHSAMHSDACVSYIQELVTHCAPPKALQSVTDGMLLSVSSTHWCLVAGDNAFSVCGPRLWNDLPLSLGETQSQTTFKRKHKTHLFDLHFGAWTFLQQ